MTEAAKAARNAYTRQYNATHANDRKAYLKAWRAKHPEKNREYQERYWEKVAKRLEQTAEENNH